MNTFLVSRSFSSVKFLDRRRLGKQRVEVIQILNALLGRGSGWRNHPAVKLWSKNIGALGMYGLGVCREWRSRGYKDNCLERIASMCCGLPTDMPRWLYTDEGELFFYAVRANLIRKDQNFYSTYSWKEQPKEGYRWPAPPQ